MRRFVDGDGPFAPGPDVEGSAAVTRSPSGAVALDADDGDADKLDAD
jgi:hypothetical protein